MTGRIDRYLDGFMEGAALAPAERAEAEIIQGMIQEARAFVTARPVPDLATGVMRRIDEVAPSAARQQRNVVTQLARSLWTARELSCQFRPAYGLIAAAAVIVLVVSWPDGLRFPFANSPITSARTEPTLFVRFHLQASDVSDVRLAGSFTHWQPQYELRQTAPGIWEITVPLSPGVHDYAFIVDGQHWVADPYAPAVDDGFGGTNSRISIVPPEDSRL